MLDDNGKCEELEDIANDESESRKMIENGLKSS